MEYGRRPNLNINAPLCLTIYWWCSMLHFLSLVALQRWQLYHISSAFAAQLWWWPLWQELLLCIAWNLICITWIEVWDVDRTKYSRLVIYHGGMGVVTPNADQEREGIKLNTYFFCRRPLLYQQPLQALTWGMSWTLVLDFCAPAELGILWTCDRRAQHDERLAETHHYQPSLLNAHYTHRTLRLDSCLCSCIQRLGHIIGQRPKSLHLLNKSRTVHTILIYAQLIDTRAKLKLIDRWRATPEADLGMCGLCGRTGAPTKRGPPHEDKHKFFYCC